MTDKHDDDNVNLDQVFSASHEEEVEAPGWDAIDEAVHKLYGDQSPKHYGTMIPYSLGGDDPLTGISAFEASLPTPHWHFITYGFSELYEKESENLEYSGFGFELTFRLPKEDSDTEPPSWALNLLQNMGRYVFGSGNIFQSGDYLDANGPIRLESDTQLTALAFIHDPQLPEIDTPNGKVEFIQMVGITRDELEAMQTWSTKGFLQASEEHMPLYITDLDRSSLTTLPSMIEAVDQGIQRDGSNTGYLFIDQLEWTSAEKKLFKKTPAILTFGAKQAGVMAKMLQGRILKGKTLTLSSRDEEVILEAGEQSQFIEEEDHIRIILNQEATLSLTSHLQPVANEFQIPQMKDLLFKIVPTHIKDQDGNVVETIG